MMKRLSDPAAETGTDEDVRAVDEAVARALQPTVFYVYVLFDAFGVPRYVGKGKDDRWIMHERYSDPKNWMKNEFIERTWILLDEIPKIKVREELLETDAYEIEIALIRSIGRWPDGPLTNMTDGGEGSSFEHTEIMKQRLSDLAVEQWFNEVTRQRIIEAIRKSSKDPKVRAARSKQVKKIWSDPEYRQRRHLLELEPWMKEKRAKASRVRWAKPGANNKALYESPNSVTTRFSSDITKKRWADPVYRQKMREQLVERWRDPVYREKMIEAAKRGGRNKALKYASK